MNKEISLDKMEKLKEDKQWLVYILLCKDSTLYTGITNDIERRLIEHNDDSPKSKAARYTRARQPVSLAYHENCENRIEASRREYAIKKLSRTKKEALILTQQ